jgi:hypothetical protein
LSSSFLIARETSPIFGLLTFSAPIAVWYVSHEGMYESIVALPVILSIVAARRRRWLAAGICWMLALQLKQFAVFVAPFFVAEIISLENDARKGEIIRFLSGTAIVFLFVLPFYVRTPDIWIRPLQTQAYRFNPFHWQFWTRSAFHWMPAWLIRWNAVATGLFIVLGTIYIFRTRSATDSLHAVPLLGFWTSVKSAAWAQFWYGILTPSFALTMTNSRRLLLAIFVIHWLQCGRSLALLSGPAFGVAEYPKTVDYFNSCLWTCDYRASGPSWP